MKNRQARVVLNRIPDDYLNSMDFQSAEDKDMVKKAIERHEKQASKSCS